MFRLKLHLLWGDSCSFSMRNKILFCFGQWHLLVPVDQSSISSRPGEWPTSCCSLEKSKSSSGSFFSRYSVSVTLLELWDSVLMTMEKL